MKGHNKLSQNSTNICNYEFEIDASHYFIQMYILSWSKQGAVMPAKAVEQNGVLIIPNLQRSDQGNYVCTGSDMFSEDSASTILIIEEGT